MLSAGRDVLQKLLSIQEAAELLHISRSLLYELAGKKLPCVRINKRILFQEERLEQWIQEHAVEPGDNL